MVERRFGPEDYEPRWNLVAHDGRAMGSTGKVDDVEDMKARVEAWWCDRYGNPPLVVQETVSIKAVAVVREATKRNNLADGSEASP